MMKNIDNLVSSGDFGQALLLIDQLISQKPKNQNLRLKKAHILLKKKDFDQAYALLTEIITQNPKNHIALDNLGTLAQMFGNDSQAVVYHLEAVKLNPSHIGYAFNLAVAFSRIGKFDDALKMYQAILKDKPKAKRPRENLAALLNRLGRLDEAIEHYQKLIEMGHDDFNIQSGLGNIYRTKGESKKALTAYKKAQAFDPDNEVINFVIAAMSGEHKETLPGNFVSGLFDDFAADFDKKLTKELSYQGPELVYDAVKKAELPDKGLIVIDLGAGTGLFGELIHNRCDKLVGVDLSQKMLKSAEKKQIYTELVKEDIGDYLHSLEKQSIDLITAVDVLNYVGKLDHVFEAAQGALKTGGYFAFTTELWSDESDDSNIDQGFMLRETMRYCHKTSYIEDLIGKNNFTASSVERKRLRTNRGQEITGEIFLLKKN